MFVGREKELNLLKKKMTKKSASFVVIRGRRRIGKSRLMKEFSKEFPKKYSFTGLPPRKNQTAQTQREEFVRQMKKQGIPAVEANDWGDIFWALGKFCESGSTLVVLDEISWMGSKDPDFLGKLKIAWDEYFEKNSKLVLIVASSVSSWIDKNILKSTGFFGRIDLTLTLKELPVKDCIKFWGRKAKSISSYEKLKILSVTGGIPKYLGDIDPKETAEENIQRLCFFEEGLLFKEFDNIFHDLFSKRGRIYKKIVQLLADRHSLNQEEICQGINRQRGRAISEYLNDLVTAGFLTDDHAWNLKTTEISPLRKYRLSDNYLRFYLKFIEPRKKEILKGKFEEGSLFSHTNWESIMGLQFENLVVHNRNILLDALQIRREDYIFDGPYFQTTTKDREGCQIDYLIQTKGTLYICEVKFSKNPIGPKIIDEMQKKIESLVIPRYVSYRAILIHVGGVTEELEYRDYFDKIIDWTEFLE